jgi:hypothetical protein
MVYQSPIDTLQALNLLGYSPFPDIWGPDQKLGTYDAPVDPEVRQFQMDFNQASRSRWLRAPQGGPAGGLSPDGRMGRCTMAGMAYALSARGAEAWRARYGVTTDTLDIPGG